MIRFKAIEIGCLDDPDALNCGASNAAGSEEYHYINFQRAAEIDGNDDEGIYFEIDDQINSGYNIIECCEINQNQLIVRLSDNFQEMPGEVIVVEFDSPSSEGMRPIHEGLAMIFIGYENLFSNKPGGDISHT